MDKNTVLVAGVIIYKESRGKRRWFIVKQDKDGGWEIPKAIVRKVESSVRAVIRMMGEQGGMTIKVLEEAGRAGGVTTVNGKTFPQRHIFYLAVQKSSEGEVLGFEEHDWLQYAQAVRKLGSKRERAMIKAARKELNDWFKKRAKKKQTK